ncbi:hypothetical protein [uncultured Pantoea sp.]|uniref:hypothetical protein n=1 Tax=uncultured Pantoea sp. TaxID=218084 RepID=UPI00258F4F0F|nr:hypothetical protein [uncultured Pantoea sp.]
MDIIVPIVVVTAVFYQLYLYGRAVYVRRMVMMKKVSDFLEREDASPRLKNLAVSAFHDAISFRLPANLFRFRKKRHDNDPRAVKAERRAKEGLRKDTSSAAALEELESLIEMMYTINLSFNQILFLIAALPHVRVERKDVSRTFIADSMLHHMRTRETC